MALVSYSDSEASDSETDTQQPSGKQLATTAPAQNVPTSGNFQPIVDRSNPRKIRVALPDSKPENTADEKEAADEEDGPARKKARVGGGGGGGGGGAFSGFNSLLPAPKRNNQNNANAVAEKKPSALSAVPERKVFGLKTGATPGFDREADAEMQRDQQTEAVGVGSREESGHTLGDTQREGQEIKEPKLVGKATMFKPLSVSRSTQKKKPKSKTTTASPSLVPETEKKPTQPPDEVRVTLQPQSTTTTTSTTTPAVPATATPKPKISLFSLSSTSEEKQTPHPSIETQPTTYEPLVYNKVSENPPAGPERPGPEPQAPSQPSPTSSVPTERGRFEPERQTQTLDKIADELNLPRSQRRQLFGREAAGTKSQAVTFNADQEYAANQSWAQQTDLAAVQHKAVRPIAPGKHTLQQLVHAASNQREALEESFATGRRNQKEAGSKYGW